MLDTSRSDPRCLSHTIAPAHLKVNALTELPPRTRLKLRFRNEALLHFQHGVQAVGFCFSPIRALHEADQEATQHTLLHFVQGCSHSALPALIILQQAEEHTIFSFKPKLLCVVGEIPTNPLRVYSKFTASFRLGRCTETCKALAKNTMTRQKTNVVLITCSPIQEVEALRTKPKQRMTQQDKHLPSTQEPGFFSALRLKGPVPSPSTPKRSAHEPSGKSLT